MRRCTAAAGSAVGRGAEATVRRAAFWTAIATHLLFFWVGHDAHHTE